MNRSIWSTLGIGVASISIICGVCGLQNATSKNGVTIVDKACAQIVDSNASSVKEAINKLANSKNYTITVSTKTGPLDIVNHMYFTENAFYDDYLGDEYGYCKVDEGVFRFDRYARKFTPSAILKDKNGNGYSSIWGNGFFYGFNDLDLSEFTSANGKEFDCSKKKNKLTFMKMFSIDQTNYPDVNSIHIVVDDDVNSVTFSVSLKGGEEHKCTISNFETTSIDYLNKQLNQGKSYYTPDATMAKIVDLFKDYNYTHFIYDTDFDKTEPVGYEKFNEDYFISGYTSEYIKYNTSALIKCSGMVGLDNYVVNDKVTMDGSYWTFLYNGSFSMITSFYYNEDSYVPNVYTYPTYLEALSNPQYFESAGTEGKYYTSKLSVVSDFCSNFQLWDSLNDNSFTPCGLFVTYDKSYHNQDTVTFSIEYDYYGYRGTTDFVFSDFNKTEEKVLEQQYIKKYVNAYYNGQKNYVTIGEGEAKKLTVQGEQAWLLDDNILEAYEYEYFKNAEAGSEIKFTYLNGESQEALNITPLDSEINDNYIVEDGKYKIKKTANTAIYIYKLKDGSWKFEAVNLDE